TFDRIIRATKRISFANSDLVIEPGDWVMGDVKTGKDLKYGFNEIAIQLALYAHADAICNGAEGVYEEMPDVRKDVALVVHLPAGKKRADLYGVDIETGWQGAELCAKVREWRKLRGVASLADSDKPSWKDLNLQASSREDLSAVWRKDSAAGEWTSELEALGKSRLQKLGLEFQISLTQQRDRNMSDACTPAGASSTNITVFDGQLQLLRPTEYITGMKSEYSDDKGEVVAEVTALDGARAAEDLGEVYIFHGGLI